MAGVQTAVTYDYYGHATPAANGVNANLASAASGTAAGTVVPGAGLSSLTSVTGCDEVVTVVGASAAAAGTAFTIYFGAPFSSVPRGVSVIAYDTTAGAIVSCGVSSLTTQLCAVAMPSVTSTHSVTFYVTISQ